MSQKGNPFLKLRDFTRYTRKIYLELEILKQKFH